MGWGSACMIWHLLNIEWGFHFLWKMESDDFAFCSFSLCCYRFLRKIENDDFVFWCDEMCSRVKCVCFYISFRTAENGCSGVKCVCVSTSSVGLGLQKTVFCLSGPSPKFAARKNCGKFSPKRNASCGKL